MINSHIPQPQRIRKIDGSFAWLDHRRMKNGFIEILTADDLLLYVFLVLVADRNGVNFYRKETLCDKISIDFCRFEIALDRLISMRLIVFEAYSICSHNGHYQVLPIRSSPPDFRSQIRLPGMNTAASRKKSDLRNFWLKKKRQNKHQFVAVTAVARKLCHIACAS